MNTTNCCLYCRVSTTDQSVDPQLLELRAYAAQHGFNIVAEYSDVISGAKAQRPGLDALLADAKGGAFNLVLAVKLDRLGRSLLNVVNLVQDLKAMKVSVLFTSQGIDNREENPCGKVMMGMLALISEFERDLIRERTKAGLRNAKANGKVLGRVSKTLIPEEQRPAVLAQWRESGAGLRVLAKNLGGVSPMTARKMANAAP